MLPWYHYYDRGYWFMDSLSFLAIKHIRFLTEMLNKMISDVNQILSTDLKVVAVLW